MNNILVSIIIPVYNTEKYLRQCIDSVLNQTFKDYEIILINDGSTDKSKEICEEYCNKFVNIKLINQENKGQSAARNEGIREAIGEYIYFMDSDDIIDSRLLEICYNEAIKANIEVLLFGHNYISDGVQVHLNNVKITLDLIKDNIIFTGKEIIKKDTLDLLSSVCTKFYKKSFLTQNNLFFKEGIIYEDAEFIPRLLICAKRVKNINMQLYLYRRRENSTTTSINYEKHIEALTKVIESLFLLLNQQDKNDKILIENIKKFINQLFKKKMAFFSNILNLEFEKKFNIEAIIKSEFYDYFKIYIKIFGFNFLEEDFLFFTEQIVRLGKIDICQHIINSNLEQKGKIIIRNIQKMVEDANKIRDEVFKKIPLNDKNKIIGIYGISNHTTALINYYRKNLGQIHAQIFFIDSFKGKKNEIIDGVKIINIEDISKNKLDGIILSSYNSEGQLLENTNKYNLKEIQVYRFYENNKILLFG